MIRFLSDSLQPNYTIITANDGVEALERLKEQEVSLIVSDWMMPNMDGVEFCKAVRNDQLSNHIPFILLTAKTDNASKTEGMNCGADAYIEKPFSLHNTLRRVSRTCLTCVCSYAVLVDAYRTYQFHCPKPRG